jgi:hypothetical protein
MDKNILKNLVKNVSSHNRRKDKETKVDKIKSQIKIEKMSRKRKRSRSRDRNQRYIEVWSSRNNYEKEKIENRRSKILEKIDKLKSNDEET